MKTSILASGKTRFPLGWTLSSETQKLIEEIIGAPEKCLENDRSAHDAYAKALTHNSCLLREIGAELGY